MVAEGPVKLAPYVRVSFFGTTGPIFFKEDVQVCQRRRARNWVSAEGETVHEARPRFKRVRHGLAHEDRAERRIRRSNSLRGRNQIWLNTEIGRTEQFAESTETADHLVHDHEDA